MLITGNELLTLAVFRYHEAVVGVILVVVAVFQVLIGCANINLRAPGKFQSQKVIFKDLF